MAKFNGFNGDYTGLTDEEFKKQQDQFGKNELVPEKKATLFGKMLQVLKEPLISNGLLTKAVIQGLVIFGATFGSYVYTLNNHWTVEAARTFALAVLIAANLFLVYVNQSDREVTIKNLFRFKDKVMFYVNLGILA